MEQEASFVEFQAFSALKLRLALTLPLPNRGPLQEAPSTAEYTQ